ncbi:MAG: hypothetical protein QOE36_2654 [Gaiellaceae bacterium]|jgi:hypothetical protein|nr:hypothetical protein [Gaiellaceae bacterium]
MKVQRLAVVLMGIGFLLLLGLVLRDRPAEAKVVPTVIRARAFELVDGHGRVRAQLNSYGDGVVFRLRDANGMIRVKLGASPDGSGLFLANETTERGIQLLAMRDETSVVLERGDQRNVIIP